MWTDGTTAPKNYTFNLTQAANEWSKAPALSADFWLKGRDPATLDLGTARFGEAVASIPEDLFALLAAGEYEIVVSVPETADYTAVSAKLRFTVYPAGKVDDVAYSFARASMVRNDNLITFYDTTKVGEITFMIMYLVAGLGNPGLKYLKNFHNVGFMAVELLAEKHGVSFNKKGFKGLYGIKEIDGEKVMFLKPQTYMNLSGESIQEAMAFYKIPTENLIVIYDDIDVAIGSIRVRRNGSAGTHNGMRNIVQMLSSTDFPRIRIGTKPEEEYDLLSYVLSDIKKEDEPRFKISINEAVESADEFIHGKNLDEIMCSHNNK